MNNQLNIHALASLKPQQYFFGSFLFLGSSAELKRRAVHILYCVLHLGDTCFGKWAPSLHFNMKGFNSY